MPRIPNPAAPIHVPRETVTYEVDVAIPRDTDDPIPTAKDIEESVAEGLLKRNMRGLKISVERLG